MTGFILIVEANTEFGPSVDITHRIKNTFSSVDLICITNNTNNRCRVFWGCDNSDDEDILCKIRDCLKKGITNINVYVFQTTTKYANYCHTKFGDEINKIAKKIEKSSELIIDN